MIATLWAWCKQSATIVWARVLMVLGVVAGILLPLLQALQAIDLTQILPPKYVAYAPLILAAIGLVTELCRRRTLPG